MYSAQSVAIDALVLKHQGISIHNADQISIVVDQFQTKYNIIEQH